MRTCSRTACSAPAVATLTFVYADSTAVLGPLSLMPEPGGYDLCPRHAERTSVPQGWQVIKLPLDGLPEAPEVVTDDLMALADAVRAIGLRGDAPPAPVEALPPLPEASGRGGHLKLVADTGLDGRG